MNRETTFNQLRNTGSAARRSRQKQSGHGRLLSGLVWWALFLVSAVFGAYALAMGGLELLAQLGLVQDAPARAVPLAFMVHALTGGIALLTGPLQFNRRLRARWQPLHRALGRVYVTSIWIASLTGLWSAIFFAEDIAAQIVFGLVAALWFAATTQAFLRARVQDFTAHCEWMIRSFALSLFFVTFPFWVEGLAATSLPEAVGYPLGVFLGWSLNLLVAELWIRRSRGQSGIVKKEIKQ
jgi:uncharacterized membrane protein